ncbi:MAG: hypothetical protein GXP30_15175 [Verrucomicrobia bacterium]|nr:hypothetical protein [Verrucomicrobiota bacterium]
MNFTFQNAFSSLAALFCAGLSVLSVACDQNAAPDEKTDVGVAAVSEESPAPTWPVPLNAGEKWKMDEHTRNSIDRMKQLIESGETATLGKSLAGEFHDLMKGCKMQGESHNQLHVFLGELMPGILALSSDENDEEFKAERSKVQKLLQEYELYFE